MPATRRLPHFLIAGMAGTSARSANLEAVTMCARPSTTGATRRGMSAGSNWPSAVDVDHEIHPFRERGADGVPEARSEAQVGRVSNHLGAGGFGGLGGAVGRAIIDDNNFDASDARICLRYAPDHAGDGSFLVEARNCDQQRQTRLQPALSRAESVIAGYTSSSLARSSSAF